MNCSGVLYLNILAAALFSGVLWLVTSSVTSGMASMS